jgi:hypothetical protein
VYSQHYSENPECPQADCGCEGHCLPDTLIATVVNYQNCTNMQGMSWALQRGPNGEMCQWNMETAYWNDNHCCMKLQFSHGGSEYGTSEASLGILREDMTWVALTLVESHCNPLYWKFCSARNPCESPVNGSWPCCEGSPPPPAPYGTQGTFCIEITPVPEP